MARNINMRNFGPINPHCTAFAPKQWLHKKEATGMESSKMYCHSQCRYRTYQCGAANYLVSWGVVYPRMEICEISDLQIPMVPHLHQGSGSNKRKLRAGIES